MKDKVNKIKKYWGYSDKEIEELVVYNRKMWYEIFNDLDIPLIEGKISVSKSLKLMNKVLVDYEDIKYDIIYEFGFGYFSKDNLCEWGDDLILEIDSFSYVIISKSLRDKNLSKIKEIII